MVRGLAMVVALTVCMGGCIKEYTVRSVDLAEARKRPGYRTGLRVVQGDGAEFFDMRYFRGVIDTDGEYARVRVKDSRPALLYSGIALLVAGGGFAAIGATRDRRDDAIFLAFGAVTGIGGIVLMSLGLLKTRPEVQADERDYKLIGKDWEPSW